MGAQDRSDVRTITRAEADAAVLAAIAGQKHYIVVFVAYPYDPTQEVNDLSMVEALHTFPPICMICEETWSEHMDDVCRGPKVGGR